MGLFNVPTQKDGVTMQFNTQDQTPDIGGDDAAADAVAEAILAGVFCDSHDPSDWEYAQGLGDTLGVQPTRGTPPTSFGGDNYMGSQGSAGGRGLIP